MTWPIKKTMTKTNTKTKTMTKTNKFREQILVILQTFDQSDEDAYPDHKMTKTKIKTMTKEKTNTF